MFSVKIGIHKYLATIIFSCCIVTRMTTVDISDKRRRGLLTSSWFYSRWHALSHAASASSSSFSWCHLCDESLRVPKSFENKKKKQSLCRGSQPIINMKKC